MMGVARSSSVSLSVLLLIDGSTFDSHSLTFKFASGVLMVNDSKQNYFNQLTQSDVLYTRCKFTFSSA